jgi:2-desacetyl-2-hydroxyethyl bacteriochlorophyllide A dehydrogenase
MNEHSYKKRGIPCSASPPQGIPRFNPIAIFCSKLNLAANPNMNPTRNHQVIFAQPGVATFTESEVAAPGPTQLLIRTRTSLISPGTERAFFLGLPNTTQSYPQAAGYCNAGEVVAMGDQVTGWQLGDRVATEGHHAAYVLSQAATAHRLPSGLSDEYAPFFNLASIALQGVRKARIELGEPVAVIGAGLIGLMALQLARLQGALPAISIDQDEGRLDFANQSGADALLVNNEGLLRELAKHTRGEGAAVVIEATGHPDAILTALACAKPFGRIVLLGSTRGETDHVNFYRDVHKKGLTLIGAHNSVRPKAESTHAFWTQVDDQRVALELLARGRLNVQPYITHRFAWHRAPEAYELLRAWDKSSLGILLDWRENP